MYGKLKMLCRTFTCFIALRTDFAPSSPGIFSPGTTKELTDLFHCLVSNPRPALSGYHSLNSLPRKLTNLCNSYPEWEARYPGANIDRKTSPICTSPAKSLVSSWRLARKMKRVPGPLQIELSVDAMVDSSSTDRLISLQELQRHNKVDDAWIVIDGKVYDVSSYVAAHPGEKAILRNVGGDSTQGFQQQAAHRVVKNHIASLLEKFYIGLLSPGEEKCCETTEST